LHVRRPWADTRVRELAIVVTRIAWSDPREGYVHSKLCVETHGFGERGSFASAVWHRERPELASGAALCS
jgi:hypothetical protein